MSGVFLVPSEQDGIPAHLLATGRLRPPDRTQDTMSPAALQLADVYAFAAADTQPMIENLSDHAPVLRDLVLFDGSPTTYTFASDSRGRLIVVQRVSDAGWNEVERFDLATGTMEEVGGNGWSDHASFILSASRTRVFCGAVGASSVLDEDGRDAIDPVDASGLFIGDDFFYVAKARSTGSTGTVVKRSRAGAKPEVVATSSGQVRLTPILGDATPQLLLSVANDSGTNPFALLDTATLQTLSLPDRRGATSFASASSDGHWLLFVAPGASAATASSYYLYDWVAGASASVDQALYDVALGTQSDWRPGHQQLWFTFGAASRAFGIWDATSVARVFDQGYPCPWLDWGDRQSMFTQDGSAAVLVEYRSRDNTVIPMYSIGPADDLSAPRTVLNPEGNELRSLREMADGRVLASVEPIGKDRQDILLVDPAAGSSRLLGSGGFLMAVGKTRVLAFIDWETSRSAGELVLIDVNTGDKTVLAESVYAVAVEPSRGGDTGAVDPLAAGTRIAYLVRERLESPYDGLWVTNLP